mmetsp:Transcript_20321/g.30561  ORF Transcript_20321/g.30561 Transcript_20321/m.30561 type:complete len:92 (-) Transcript_20321:216-491(-)
MYDTVAPPNTIAANNKNRGSSKISRPRGQKVYAAIGCDKTWIANTIAAVDNVVVLGTVDEGIGIHAARQRTSSANDGTINAENGFHKVDGG